MTTQAGRRFVFILLCRKKIILYDKLLPTTKILFYETDVRVESFNHTFLTCPIALFRGNSHMQISDISILRPDQSQLVQLVLTPPVIILWPACSSTGASPDIVSLIKSCRPTPDDWLSYGWWSNIDASGTPWTNSMFGYISISAPYGVWSSILYIKITRSKCTSIRRCRIIFFASSVLPHPLGPNSYQCNSWEWRLWI